MIQHWPADVSDWQQHIGRTNWTSHFFTFFKFNQDCWWLFCQRRSNFFLIPCILSCILLTPCAQPANHRFPCKVSQLSLWLAHPKSRWRGSTSASMHLSCADFGGWHGHCMSLPWNLIIACHCTIFPLNSVWIFIAVGRTRDTAPGVPSLVH